MPICPQVLSSTGFWFLTSFWHQISRIFVTIHRTAEASIMEGSSISKKKSAIPEGLLPSYLATAFGEIYEEDGLAVLGKGLGWLSLLAAFVRFYSDVEEGHMSIMKEKGGEVKGKPPLVLVLGLRDSEHEALLSLLEIFHTPQHMLPTLITNESGQGKDRARKSSLWKTTSWIAEFAPHKTNSQFRPSSAPSNVSTRWSLLRYKSNFDRRPPYECPPLRGCGWNVDRPCRPSHE